MSDFRFPSEIERFIEQVNDFLGFFKRSMTVLDEDPKAQQRIYVLDGEGEQTTVSFHRTVRSLNLKRGEYRVRVRAPVHPDLATYVRGEDSVLNRFAMLGGYISADDGGAVWSQALITHGPMETLAGVIAASAVHSRSAVLEHMRKMTDASTSSSIEQLSAWTDLDFEQIHYDYAHLGVGSIHQREWTMQFGIAAMLTLQAVHNNPYWGGPPVLLRVPNAAKLCEGRFEVNSLNHFANSFDDVPYLGGWCSDGDDFVFAQFAPNLLRGLPAFTDLIIDWAHKRTNSLPDLVDMISSGNLPSLHF